jgi:hypothetical protein
MTRTSVAEVPEPSAAGTHEPGYQPLVTHAGVRTPTGLVATDEHGEVRLDAAGNMIWCQRAELIDITFWRHAGLMIDQKILLPISQQDWESAARCKHDRRWASEELAKGFKCDVPAKVTSL